jgi:hypothetical protein
VRLHVAFEQTPILGQQDAVFLTRDAGQLLIVEFIFVQCIESQHAQIPGQPTQVCIQDEAHIPQGCWLEAYVLGDVDRLTHGEDTDPITFPKPTAEIDRLAVCQDQINLGVGHTQRLDWVLD